jgi:hypothetical protein
MGKIKTMATIFELPQRLGILQYVEYEPPPREWCSSDWCPHEGVLTAEGCKKGICIKYRVVVLRDKRQWVVAKKKKRDEDRDGCLRQQIADALWELAERGVDVGVWRRRVEEKVDVLRYEVRIYCGPVVNGVELEQPPCRTAEECARQILEDYKNEVRRRSEPPPPDPVEELLKEWPELAVFGREWVERFEVLRDRLAEIAKVLRQFPWMMEVISSIDEKPSPYGIFVFVAGDGSDAYLSFDWQKAYRRVQNGVKEVQLELERSKYEEHNGKKVEVYRPRGLLAFTTTAKEYVRVL